jgi:hypothetical protein
MPRPQRRVSSSKKRPPRPTCSVFVSLEKLVVNTLGVPSPATSPMAMPMVDWAEPSTLKARPLLTPSSRKRRPPWFTNRKLGVESLPT